MLTFCHRYFLARGLGLSPTGWRLPDAEKKRLDTMLARGVSWMVLSRCMTQSEWLATKEPQAKHVEAFESLAWVAKRLIGSSLHHDIRNELDFVMYVQELRALQASNIGFPIEVVFLLTDSMSRLAPKLSLLWKAETAKEITRKDLITKAGLDYERHVYPNYAGCDELFFDGPWPQEDPVLQEAKKRLSLA